MKLGKGKCLAEKVGKSTDCCSHQRSILYSWPSISCLYLQVKNMCHYTSMRHTPCMHHKYFLQLRNAGFEFTFHVTYINQSLL